MRSEDPSRNSYSAEAAMLSVGGGNLPPRQLALVLAFLRHLRWTHTKHAFALEVQTDSWHDQMR